MSPKGKKINQNDIKCLSKCDEVIFLCIKNKGLDNSIDDLLSFEKISIGDYIVNSGDISTLIIINSLTRLNANIINQKNLKTDTFHKNIFSDNNHISPNKTWKSEITKKTPEKKIKFWKKNISISTTSFYRPDLIKKRLRHD